MKSIKVIVLGAVLALASLVGAVSFSASASAAESRECGDNAILRCGAMSASELKKDYADNDRGLKDIYSYYNIDASDIAASGSAKTGYVHTDGTVTVDGKVVATNASTVGRSSSLGGHRVNANGHTVYQGPNRLKSTLSAFVFFNADGTYKSAVLKVCGNPVPATPKAKPVYKCEALTASSVTLTKFNFTTTATAKSGATIKDYVYSFGDGKTATAGATTSHEYAAPGTYNVNVKVRVNVNGTTVTAPGDCTAKVTVKPADKPSITITKTVNGGEHATVPVGTTFTYQIVVTNTGNVALKNAVVTDNAPKEVTPVSASAGTISGQTWTYTIPSLAVKQSMSFTITAKYTVFADGTHVNTVCVDTPTIPDTNPDACDNASTSTGEKITVCDTNNNSIITIDRKDFDASHMTTDQSKCVPAELPHTGISDIISSGLGVIGLVGATYYYVNSRRSLR